ncbi:MAG: sugar nucleotide-binding protein, partial [Phenylobacterium sp.]
MSLAVLQFGTTGQVARELIRQAADDGVEVTALSRAEADFAGDPEAVARLVAQHRPDLVIVAA